MEVLEQHLEEEKIAVNSTIFIRSNIESEEKAISSTSTFLEKMKWPIIGSLVAIISLIFIGLMYIFQLKKTSRDGVTVEINNAANANNESPSCSMGVANQVNIPIQHFVPPPELFQEGANQILEGAQQFHEGARVQDAPPDYYSTVDINSILAIPPADRNPFETREAIRYISMRKPSAPQPEQ